MYPNDAADYARGRLVETIIRHMGKAVIVNDVRFDTAKTPLRVSARQILSGKEVADKIDNFDLSPVPLGFVNYGRDNPNVYYLARTPIRNDWRQGFRKNNAAWLYGVPRWDYKEIAHTIEGDFPDLGDAIHLAAASGGSVAWTREFAVSGKALDILHRFYGKVGNFVDDMKVVLDPNCIWVEENLKDAIQ